MPAARFVTLTIFATIIAVHPQILAGDDDQDRKIPQLEIPDDKYIPVSPGHRQTSPPYQSSRSGFFFTQANVDANGENVVGDAANEPSIAVDPTNPDRIAIGWRQFDTITNNFRQAGNAHTTDGGLSWTFPGVIDPGLFRSDPVLDSDINGVIYYNSLSGDFSCQVFRSYDGGATWDSGVEAWGGDKQWMTIDKTQGTGQGHIYAYWTEAFTTCDGFFTRSTDGGDSYEACIEIDNSPFWGTLTVGPEGDLYIGGVGPTADFVVVKSTTAQDSGSAVTWDTSVTVTLDGTISAFSGDTSPNPGGLLGQTWIATDHSDGPTQGNVYLLGSVERFSNSDPLDVMFARSTDGGLTWSDPVRVNDDPSEAAFQWFGTMSVSPDGRIDVIWLDTRDNVGEVLSSLYYSFSTDAGVTWSVNERLSDAFDPHVGWPNQNKMGDYYDMVSDSAGAHLAWSATFNGEQDVYYGRIIAGAFVPEAPALVSPPDGGEDQPLSLPLVWDGSIGATTYRVQVDTTGSFASPLVDDSLVTLTSYDLNDLETGTEYFWRVNAKSDGGTSPWSDAVDPLPDPAPDGLCGISVVSDSVVYATGRICGTPRLMKSTDRGTTWSTIDLSSSIDRLIDTYFITPDAGFVVGGVGEIDAVAQGRVLYTWDGGATWDIRHTTESIGHWCWKISFPSLNTGYVSLETFHTGITSYFLKTTNGGVTWEENLLVGGYREQGIGFATTEIGWAGGSILTYGTTDGGLTWSQDNFGSNINRFRMLNDSLGFAIGKRVYKYSYEPATTVQEPDALLPEAYTLNQNYPNPFNPSTTISFKIPDAVPVLLQVYNIMGHHIATLIDGQREAGTHVVNFDASDLAAGVYYYRLEAGTFIDSRRMMYLK